MECDIAFNTIPNGHRKLSRNEKTLLKDIFKNIIMASALISPYSSHISEYLEDNAYVLLDVINSQSSVDYAHILGIINSSEENFKILNRMAIIKNKEGYLFGESLELEN